MLPSPKSPHPVTTPISAFSTEHRMWSTVGASHNIIEASMQAVVDGIEYGLMEHDTDSMSPPA